MALSQTSRTPLIDAVELIANQVALSSHLYELLGFLQKEQQAEFSADRDTEMQEVLSIIERTTQSRRDLMSAIEKQYKTNDHYWCAAKHAIAAYGIACELHQAYSNDVELKNTYFDIMVVNQQTLYIVLSKWLGLDEVVICGRCISDKLSK